MKSGKDLFYSLTDRDFSGSEQDEYAQTLMTIHGNIREEIYPLLELAESQGKKLVISNNEADELMVDDISIV